MAHCLLDTLVHPSHIANVRGQLDNAAQVEPVIVGTAAGGLLSSIACSAKVVEGAGGGVVLVLE